jgi:hypothetical protein
MPGVAFVADGFVNGLLGFVFIGCVPILPEVLGTLEVSPEIKSVEIRHKTPITPAKIHVPFSSTSVVCFTPINWLLKPAILPASPPPFGFCTSTIRPRITLASITIITKRVVISGFL